MYSTKQPFPLPGKMKQPDLSAFWCASGTYKNQSNVDCDVGSSFAFALLATVPCGNAGLALLVIWPWPVTTWDRSHAHTRAQTKRKEVSSWCKFSLVCSGLSSVCKILTCIFKSRANQVSKCYSQRRGHAHGHQLSCWAFSRICQGEDEIWQGVLFLEQLAQTLQGLKQLLMFCVFLFHFL